ncbi:MAG: peptide-methionine (S)-S-oxide reductase [Mycobacterium sp.]
MTVFLALTAALFIGPGDHGPSPRASASTTIPGPTVDEPAPVPGSSETALLAGGCFWGVQGVFQHVKGVSQAVSGYAGGDASTAQYEAVGTGTTGPAEDYHQDYLNSHPDTPYIAENDMPKLDDLRQMFPELYRDQPVLVHAPST